jgi:hypothetical protein
MGCGLTFWSYAKEQTLSATIIGVVVAYYAGRVALRLLSLAYVVATGKF